MGVVRRQWRVQPPVGTGIDWSNPLARALTHLLLPGALQDAAFNQSWTQPGSPVALVATSGGRAYQISSSNYLKATVGYPVSASPWTYLCVYTPTATTAQSIAGFAAPSYGSYIQDRTLFASNGSAAGPYSAYIYDGNTETVASSVYPVVGSTVALMARASASVLSVGVNGVVTNKSVSSTGTSTYASTVGLWLASGAGGVGAVYGSGQIALFAHFLRAISDAEYQQWVANPWQLFQPQRARRSYSIASGVSVALTGSSITGAAGSLTLAHANVLTGISVATHAGTLLPALSRALSGISGTLSTGFLTPVHQRALSGASATFSAGTITYTTFGVSVALTGQMASFLAGTLKPSSTKALSGARATASAGTLTGNLAFALSGSKAIATAGSLSTSRQIALFGAHGAFTAGTVTYRENDVTIALAGAKGTFRAGVITASGGGGSQQLPCGGFLSDVGRHANWDI